MNPNVPHRNNIKAYGKTYLSPIWNLVSVLKSFKILYNMFMLFLRVAHNDSLRKNHKPPSKIVKISYEWLVSLRLFRLIFLC